MRKLITHWKRNWTAFKIRRDRRYFATVAQDMGFQRSNRLTWHILLLLEPPPEKLT